MRTVETPLFVRAAVERLAQASPPEQTALFGSYAKRNARPGSDVVLHAPDDVVEAGPITAPTCQPPAAPVRRISSLPHR
jgi:hypothetical protein